MTITCSLFPRGYSCAHRAVCLLLGMAACLLPGASLAQTASSAASTGTAERIVSLNGSNTELLFALGVGDQVVGRDDSSIYPPEVFQVPSIGYQYQLNAESILALKPALVIGRADAKPATVIDQLRAAGLRIELIDEPQNFDEAADRILTLGTLVNREERAGELAAELRSGVEKFEARKAEIGGGDAVKAVFIYLRGPGTTFVLGEATNPGRMLALAGAENPLPEIERTAPVTAEALVSAQPDVIVTFTHGIESVGGIEGLMKLPGVSLTPAAKNRRIIVMDDLYLGGFTNRAGKAALDLLNALQAEGPVTVEGR